MMPDKVKSNQMEQFIKAVLLSISIGSLFCAVSVYADSPTIPTLDQVIENISGNIQNLVRLATSIGYVVGLWFVIKGVIELRHFGEMRTMMSQERGIGKPLILLSIGAALIYLPSSISSGIATIFNYSVPYGYQVDTSNPWANLIHASFVILQLIGVVAFIRGLIVLSSLGGAGGQQNALARGMSHIIGGILCINMYYTVRVVLATMGMSQFIGS